jgi:AraC-like DNA-binding protein
MLPKVPRIVIGVIERRSVLIDQSSTNAAAMLHLPDVRLTDIETRLLEGEEACPFEGEARDRAILFFSLAGDYLLEFPGTGEPVIKIEKGGAVGLQSGRRHRITAVGKQAGRQLFVSSIQRKAALLHGLDHEAIIVPPDAEPSASIIRHAVAIHLIEHQTRVHEGYDMVIRRCAEIVMAELVRHARTTVVDSGEVPHGIARDEYLLRAWSAYYAAPRDRWTVKALATQAGLGRSAFSKRFTEAVGVPPLTAITDLRLEQAVAMLREEKTPLIEIAFTVGYNSEAAFVRAFSRKFGMPPGRFRHEQAIA